MDIPYTPAPIRREDMAAFTAEANIFLPPILPSLFRSIKKSKNRFIIAESDVARAKPPCFKGPISKKQNIIFAATATEPTRTGVKVSLSE